jgi:LPS export ABC transporter permease LptG
MLFVRRDRMADRPFRLPLPDPLRRARASGSPGMLRLPFVSLLDRYIAATYARILLLTGSGMLAIFYVSTFIDLSDKLFKGETSFGFVAQYFWFATPQYLYYTIPMSVLLAALVTIAALTRSSELVVMKACGISLYRVAVPLVVAAVLAAAALFALQESVLGPANRRADAIRHTIRGHTLQTFGIVERRWVAGTRGEIYHYQRFDPQNRELIGLSVYEPGPGLQGLASRTFAERATYVGAPKGLEPGVWRIEDGWRRDFDQDGVPGGFTAFRETRKALESASYFGAEQPDPSYMGYAQLRDHLEQLKSAGVDVLEYQSALARKIAFPFVTIVMTLIAVPFAVTTGRRGAMAGIAVGLALALVYWTTVSIFGAIGAGGLIAPALAAWAPNLLFAAGAAYLLLTVRT